MKKRKRLFDKLYDTDAIETESKQILNYLQKTAPDEPFESSELLRVTKCPEISLNHLRRSQQVRSKLVSLSSAHATVYWTPPPPPTSTATPSSEPQTGYACAEDVHVRCLEEEERALRTCLAAMEGKKARIDAHIDALHRYNEIKDTAQMLMGSLAEAEGLRTKDIYERYDVDWDD